MMKRATLTGVNKPLLVSTYPIPDVPNKGMLIKVLRAGICHTELHMLDDNIPLGGGKVFRLRDIIGDDGYIGMTPGHEICGTVIGIGSDVTEECTFRIGDRIMVFPYRGCGVCDMCTHGKNNWCEHNKSTCTDIGKGMDGRKHGGFQSHFPLPEWQNAVKLPENIPPEIGCMLPCSALTTYSSFIRSRESIDFAIRVRGKANLLVIGAGGLGMWAVLNARALFKDKVSIICADISEEKLLLAKSYGADDVVLVPHNASPDELVSKVTEDGSRKMDVAFDIVGAPATVKSGFHSLHNGGTLVCIGLSGGEMIIPTPNIIYRSISIIGNRVGDIQQLQDITDMYEKSGLDKIPPYVLYDIDNVNEAIDKLRTGQIEGRAILKFD